MICSNLDTRTFISKIETGRHLYFGMSGGTYPLCVVGIKFRYFNGKCHIILVNLVFQPLIGTDLEDDEKIQKHSETW